MSVISQQSCPIAHRAQAITALIILTASIPTNLNAQDPNAPPTNAQIDGRLSGSNWDPAKNGAAPILIAPNDDAATVHMSLSQLSAYNERLERDKFKAAQAATPYTLKRPKPRPAPSRTLDVWSRTKLDGFTNDASGKQLAEHFGADIALDRGIIIGTRAELTENASKDGNTHDSRLVGPYFAAQLTPNLQFDAKTAWGETRSPAQGSEATVTDRHTSAARLSGHWNWNAMTIAPSATILKETQRPRSTTPNTTAVDTTRLNVRPEIRRPFKLEGGEVLEPFANLEGSLDLTAKDGAQRGNATERIDKVGAGVSLKNPSGYTVRATTDVEGLSQQDDPTLKTRLKVTVPLD